MIVLVVLFEFKTLRVCFGGVPSAFRSFEKFLVFPLEVPSERGS
jgi:hypothetical protein